LKFKVDRDNTVLEPDGDSNLSYFDDMRGLGTRLLNKSDL